MKKILVLTMLILALFAVTVNAGVMEAVKTVAAGAKDGGLFYGLAALVILYLFKVIPNDKIYAVVNKFFYGLGVALTIGMSKWKVTGPLWNKTIEPWLIDFFENTVGAAVQGLIGGARSDSGNG